MIKEYTECFKEWVERHNHDINWNWDDPAALKNQLIEEIIQSKDFDIEAVFALMFCSSDPGLSVEQTGKFVESYIGKMQERKLFKK